MEKSVQLLCPLSAPLTCLESCGESSWEFLQEDAIQRREGWPSQGTAAKILRGQSLLPCSRKALAACGDQGDVPGHPPHLTKQKKGP